MNSPSSIYLNSKQDTNLPSGSRLAQYLQGSRSLLVLIIKYNYKYTGLIYF